MDTILPHWSLLRQVRPFTIMLTPPSKRSWGHGRVRSAVAFPTTLFCSREMLMLTEKIKKHDAVIGRDFDRCIIDDTFKNIHRQRYSFNTVFTKTLRFSNRCGSFFHIEIKNVFLIIIRRIDIQEDPLFRCRNNPDIIRVCTDYFP